MPSEILENRCLHIGKDYISYFFVCLLVSILPRGNYMEATAFITKKNITSASGNVQFLGS
jgi:hypothetical protein